MKTRYKDLTGQKFGRLTVIGLKESHTRKKYWICQCECGNIKTVRSDSLQSGAIRSCGCLKKEQDKKNLTKHYSHMQSGTRLYNTWQGMKSRCYNIHDPRYHRYGGRGIAICEQWLNDFNSFYDWSMHNGYDDILTIDRIDNEKGYDPDNCRWVDLKTQSRNRDSNIRITIGNATKTLIEWCEIFELDYKAIHARYTRNGYTGIDDLFNC